MNLDVTKITFEKYLVNLGYNYKINQFEDFKLSIFRIIKRTIMNSIENDTISETIDAIFNKDISMKALENISEIKNIKDSFITSLIEEGLFDLFLENRKIKITEREKESIYIATKAIKIIENSTNYKTISFLKKEYLSKQKISVKKIKEIMNDKIDISLVNEDQLNNEIKTKIIFDMIQNNINFTNRESLINNHGCLEGLVLKLKDLVNLDEGIKYFNFRKIEELVDITKIKEYLNIDIDKIQTFANNAKASLNHSDNYGLLGDSYSKMLPKLVNNLSEIEELMELIKNEKSVLKIIIDYDGETHEVN